MIKEILDYAIENRVQTAAYASMALYWTLAGYLALENVRTSNNKSITRLEEAINRRLEDLFNL